METFVNRIGAFSIENAERLRRIGKVYQQLRRSLRQQILNNVQRSNIMATNYAGFLYGTSYAVEQHSPHGVLAARLFTNASGNSVPSAWTQTYQESLGNLGLNNTENFRSTACVGMEALLRPYSNDFNNANLSYMVQPDTTWEVNNLITSSGSLNPLQPNCDVQWLTSGDEYVALKTNKGLTDYATARSVALRGPVMIQGWGYDVQGKPVPNSGALANSPVSGFVDFQMPLTGCNNSFIDNYLRQSYQWPTAPLDVAFDKVCGTWASRGMILHGVNSGTIYNDSRHFMQVYIHEKATSEFIQYTPWLGVPGTGNRMTIGWNPWERYWEILGSNC